VSSRPAGYPTRGLPPAAAGSLLLPSPHPIRLQLKELLDRRVLEAMAAVLATPGWEAAAEHTRRHDSSHPPPQQPPTVVTGAPIALAALYTLATVPGGSVALARVHGLAAAVAPQLISDDTELATMAAATLGPFLCIHRNPPREPN
jgi:hypothetical protein